MITPNSRRAFSTLRQLVPERAPQEHCERCSAALPDEHTHLVEPQQRQLICVCDECAVSLGEQQDGKYRRVPRRVRFLPDFQLDDAQWDSLLIPVGMAFFFHSTPANKVVAYYPSPAGATESLLDLASWQELVQANPVLDALPPDVEALLVNRIKNAREYYLAPIDKCYELVGLIRTQWRGLGGGSEVWQAIGSFFDRLKKQAVEEPRRA